MLNTYVLEVIVALAVGIVALLFAFGRAGQIQRLEAGTQRMKEIAEAIHEGAMAFLNREYRSLFVFIVILAVVIFGAGIMTSGETMQPQTAIAFIVGAICSILAGFIGMNVATKANVRTAHAAQKGMGPALSVAYGGGWVMGMSVVGLGLAGLSVVFLLLFYWLAGGDTANVGFINAVNGFGLGASSIALFARVGGGIYTKAADVGADLVGKVEAGIPEDDPRNPAVIADNVGDNVGDVAGMGADLFESYVGSIIAAMAIAAFSKDLGFEFVVLPLLLAAGGTIASLIGSAFVKGGEGSDPSRALSNGTYASGALVIVLTFVIAVLYMNNWGVFISVVAGLVAGTVIGLLTEYYTSEKYKPVKDIASASETGTATNIISGIAVGMLSTMLPILFIAIAILIAYYFGGLYGIAMSAVGMLSTTGQLLAVDAYGPIADNAGGIAEMSKMDPKVREVTDSLDAVGNTTAAIGKGVAIGSAALTALALFSAYSTATGLAGIDLLDPRVIVGLFLGGMLPFLFTAITMQAVGRAAFQMIREVRRQFKEIPGIMEGTGRPDYARAVDISTGAALKEMVLPGVLAVAAPLLIGFLLGAEALGGLLAGSLVSGVLLAIMMANAGGAWDNAKKYVEAGHHGGKGTEAHAAAVVGDTVGDPFKDTSGPSLNILIKLMSIVALVFSPLFAMM